MSRVKRYAIVKRGWVKNHAALGSERNRLEAYLPGNYEVERTLEDGYIIGGVDSMGWTLDDYVLPRLRSGLITARELTPEEIVTWVVEA